MKFAPLLNRGLVCISGPDATKFLENIVTCKIDGMQSGESRFGALLSPQGKILFDFFVFKHDDQFTIDIDISLVSDFIKRMTFYKLRAEVSIEQIETGSVFAIWDGSAEGAFSDTRMPKMGVRWISSNAPDGVESDYLEHRVLNGVPEGGLDFEYGNAYPHEALMDQTGGVDFTKGCYVGQEIVSRMQHRGTTKKRIIKIKSASLLPVSGTEILGDAKPLGTLGTSVNNEGLALVRLDRVAKASEISADDNKVTLYLQDWVNFKFPEFVEPVQNAE